MCGDNTNELTWPEIHALYRLTAPKDGALRPRLQAEQRPGRWGLVVRYNRKTQERSADLLVWGLVPHWATDSNGWDKTYNARAETVAVKRSYAEPFRKRRCIIPATAFVENRNVGKRRGGQYAFSMADGRPMAIAGIWDGWRYPRSDQWFRSYSMITVEPNPLVAEIHDRMPAILPPEHWAAWLGEEPATEAELLAMLQPYPDHLAMRVRQVTDRPIDDRQLGLDATLAA